MPRTDARPAVVFGGPSPEHDVSILTGLQALHELERQGAEPRGVYFAKTGDFYEVAARLEASDFEQGLPKGAELLRLASGGGGFQRARRLGRASPAGIDLVVNACHGGPGEDGTLQAALELAGIAVAGPTVAGAAFGMDKLAFGAVVAGAGMPTLPRVVLRQDLHETGFEGPYILKPRYGGSSIGVEVAEDLPTALARLAANVHLRAGAVLEPYRPELFDLNVAVRAWPEVLLSAIERPTRRRPGAEILGYADKYVGPEGMAGAPREIPAAVDPGLEKALRAAAADICVLAGVRGVARIDFLSDGESWFVNEINTIPGSLARHLWIDPPLSFMDLLGSLMEEALSRPRNTHSAAGADGSLLASAARIASKLS